MPSGVDLPGGQERAARGLEGVVPDEARLQFDLDGIGLFSATNLDEVRASVRGGGQRSRRHGWGVDLEDRLEIVREGFLPFAPRRS